MKYSSARDNDLVTGLRMNELKILGTCCALLLIAPLSLTAGERIDCKSPDGKFALRETFNELNPIHGDSAIIESGTRKVAVQLHGDEPAGSEKLVWSKDSKRVAYFFEKGGGSWIYQMGMRVFSGTAGTSSFNEIALPELPTPKLPKNATGSEPDTAKRVEPIEWNEPNERCRKKARQLWYAHRRSRRSSTNSRGTAKSL